MTKNTHRSLSAVQALKITTILAVALLIGALIWALYSSKNTNDTALGSRAFDGIKYMVPAGWVNTNLPTNVAEKKCGQRRSLT